MIEKKVTFNSYKAPQDPQDKPGDATGAGHEDAASSDTAKGRQNKGARVKSLFGRGKRMGSTSFSVFGSHHDVLIRQVHIYDGERRVSDTALAPSSERPAPAKSLLKLTEPAADLPKPLLFDGTAATVPEGHVYLREYEGKGAMMLADHDHQSLGRASENDRQIRAAFGLNGGGIAMLKWIGAEQGFGNFEARKAALTMRAQKIAKYNFFLLPNQRLFSLPPVLAELPYRGDQRGADLSYNKISHLPGSLFASPLLDKVEYENGALLFLAKPDATSGKEVVLGALSLRGNPIAALLAEMPRVTTAQQALDVHEAVERFGLGLMGDGSEPPGSFSLQEVQEWVKQARKLDAEGAYTREWQHPRE